ncbi:ADP-ribosylation factor GTPase-activating protein 2 isoform X2 [Eurosta solidaginis]|uniref:ADP-ribosylation factor GTPase-activating protein 2 isoform X2 n=1 Tax=Eurosta solidaginis TaxID=178769 RepID=UPI00353064BC
MANSVAAGPTKQDIEALFHRLRAKPANKACFDCSAKLPTWSSVTYGIFICIDCSAVHRNLGVHLTFVRSTNLDTNWTWLQLRQMQLGGNANAAQFFRQHNCVTTDAQQKYNSRAAQLYRDKLGAMAQQAMKVHGTKLGILPPTPILQSSNEKPTIDGPTVGEPTVNFLNSVVPPPAVAPSIGVRKIQPKKSGLGARKGGLGATKVKTNFAEIEQRAHLANQFKEVPSMPDKPLTAEEELESVASMRLAYQDLSMQKTREEAKLKSIDPAKAKQMERLGMGFSLRGSDVSHSAISDMQTIQQSSGPRQTQSHTNKSSSITTCDDMAYIDSVLGEYTCNLYIDNIGMGVGRGGVGSSASGNKASKLDKRELEMMGFEAIEPITGGHSNITSMFSGGSDGDAKSTKTTTTNTASKGKTTDYSNNFARKNSATSSKSNSSFDDTSAQQKFGGAKGFGSDQYFGNESGQVDRRKANLTRFQNSDSISSSEYFGNSEQDNRGSQGYNTGVNFQTPDLDDVKESVRQGVHKVAGRLSSIANDVMSSIQDKYGY